MSSSATRSTPDALIRRRVPRATARGANKPWTQNIRTTLRPGSRSESQRLPPQKNRQKNREPLQTPGHHRHPRRCRHRRHCPPGDNPGRGTRSRGVPDGNGGKTASGRLQQTTRIQPSQPSGKIKKQCQIHDSGKNALLFPIFNFFREFSKCLKFLLVTVGIPHPIVFGTFFAVYIKGKPQKNLI